MNIAARRKVGSDVSYFLMIFFIYLRKIETVNVVKSLPLLLKTACCLWLWLLAGILPAAGQYYTTGEDPAWVRWRQIQSRYFNIIYPSTLEPVAQRYAWLFDAASDSIRSPLNARMPKLPVVLHAYNVASNGVVAWAPSRMELITTPPPDGYPQAWDKQLVLHETRHVAQMSKTGENVIKVLHGLIGDQAEGLTVGIFIPGWYLEGDATVSETALSSTGRGRNAKFLMAQKAYILEGKRFKWDMWKNGSFRYLIPNQYELGYRMSTYAYLNAGAPVFGHTFDYTTRRIYAIPPFNRGLKKNAGMSEKQLEAQSFAALQKIYTREDSLRSPDAPHRPLTPRLDDYQAYRYPVVIRDGRIIAVRNTLNRTSQLVEIDTAGKVHPLRHTGAINSHLHYSHGMVYWTEITPDPRWPQQNYSVIKAYNTYSREVYTLTRKTRFFGVSINPGGTALTTVENTPEGLSRIVAIPLVMQGKRPKLHMQNARYVNAAPYQVWKHTVWPAGTPENQARVVATLLTDNGLGLYEVNLESGACTPLIKDGFQDIKRLTTVGSRQSAVGSSQSAAASSQSAVGSNQSAAASSQSAVGSNQSAADTANAQLQTANCQLPTENCIVFETDYDGTNNIYALTLGDKRIYRLTNARLGAFDPTFSADGKTMVYANYHTYGYEIVKAGVDSLLWTQNSFSQPYRHAWADSLSALARFNIDTLPVPRTFNYSSKPYHKLAHLFRFHSWAPVYINPDGISELSLEKFTDDVGLGVTLFSQNTLGTAVGRMGYRYAHGFHSGHLEFTYKGWYPVIELNLDVNDRKASQTDLRIHGNALHVVGAPRADPYIDASARLYIPFNFSSNGWQRGLVPQVDAHFTNDAYLTPGLPAYRLSSSTYFSRYLLGGITWYNRLAMAHRELYPRWGYMVKLLYLNPLSPDIYFGDVMAVQLTTYNPGILPNHSLQLRAGYQWQNSKGKIYSRSLLSPPRGYQSTYFEKEAVFSADYSFPLFYPHWNISWVAYFKRVQMNLFSDYAACTAPQGNRRILSAGFDLSVDGHLFGFDFPINAGIRCAFPLTDGPLSTGRPSPTFSVLFDIKFD
jgi:hypothetical protein